MGVLEIIGAAIAAIISALFIGRAQGAKRASQRAKDADNDRADAIRDAADRARRADDGGASDVDQLRDAGKLRD